MLEDTILKLFALIDSIVELYLKTVIKPLLTFHEKFYSGLNKALRKVLDDNRAKIPDWFTANWITYARTVLVVPTILVLSWGYTLLPSFLVIFVDFGDFLDGVVARFWVDVKKEIAEKLSQSEKSPTPSNSDDESYGKHCSDFSRLTTSCFSWTQKLSCRMPHHSPLCCKFCKFLYRGRYHWIATNFLFVVVASPQQYIRGIRRCRL